MAADDFFEPVPVEGSARLGSTTTSTGSRRNRLRRESNLRSGRGQFGRNLRRRGASLEEAQKPIFEGEELRVVAELENRVPPPFRIKFAARF